MKPIQEWTDAFDNQISDRTNVLDLASHYPYSPERWRLFVDGTRKFPEYNSVSQYNHATDTHELKPAGGETVVFESAERPRYVVQYELAATFAFTINQDLTSGDSILVGLYDGSDGWYLEVKGSEHDNTTADFVAERAGSEVYREQDVSLGKTIQSLTRFKVDTGWYNITRQRWEQSFSRDGDQVNDVVLEKGAPDSDGPQVGNLPIHFEVTADSSTSNLILDAGSAAQVNLGRTTAQRRSKKETETISISTTNTWVPLFGLRVDPDRDIVNTQLAQIAIPEFTGGADIEVSAHAFDTSKALDSNGNELTDSDFSTPATTTSQNSVVEVTTNLAQFPDSSGTVGTSASDPGGFQIGRTNLFTGSGQTVTNNFNSDTGQKRPIYGRDVIGVLANAGATGDVVVQYRTEQDW